MSCRPAWTLPLAMPSLVCLFLPFAAATAAAAAPALESGSSLVPQVSQLAKPEQKYSAESNSQKTQLDPGSGFTSEDSPGDTMTSPKRLSNHVPLLHAVLHKKHSAVPPVLHQLGPFGRRRAAPILHVPLKKAAVPTASSRLPRIPFAEDGRGHEPTQNGPPCLEDSHSGRKVRSVSEGLSRQSPAFSVIYNKRGEFTSPLLHSPLLGKRGPVLIHRLDATSSEKLWAPESLWYKRNKGGRHHLMTYSIKGDDSPLLRRLPAAGKQEVGIGSSLHDLTKRGRYLYGEKRLLNGPVLHLPGGIGKRRRDWLDDALDLDLVGKDFLK